MYQLEFKPFTGAVDFYWMPPFQFVYLTKELAEEARTVWLNTVIQKYSFDSDTVELLLLTITEIEVLDKLIIPPTEHNISDIESLLK